MRFLFLLSALTSITVSARDVKCIIYYGGEEFPVLAAPTLKPYQVKPTSIGSYFQFKAVNIETPASMASISLYVYGVASGSPILIHQAKFLPPHTESTSVNGFTGLNYVYEPSKGSEIQYRCF